VRRLRICLLTPHSSLLHGFSGQTNKRT
jgi:hypothetical protein